MDRKQKKGNSRIGLIFAASLSLGISLLAIFLSVVGFGTIIDTIRSVDIQLMFFAFLLDMAGLLLYGTGWYVLLRGAGLKIRFWRTISIALAGIFACYATPSGFFMDASRVLLASKESDVRIGDGAATVILHKITFTLGFVTFALLSMTMLFVSYGFPRSLAINILTLTILIVAGIVVISLLVIKGHKIRCGTPSLVDCGKSILRRLVGKHYSTVVSSIGGLTSDFRRTFTKLIRHPKAMLFSYALALSYWATSVLIFYVVFLALRQNVSIWVIMLTISIGDFVQMTPIAIPGMLGVLEMVTTTVLVMFGVPLNIAASATILARIATFWFDLPITGCAASYYGAKYVAGLASSLSKISD